MTMTLDEVRKTRFHMSRRNGYEVTDVDIFVDKVEATIATLTEENEALRRQAPGIGESGMSQADMREIERLHDELNRMAVERDGMTQEMRRLQAERDQARDEAMNAASRSTTDRGMADEMNRLRRELEETKRAKVAEAQMEINQLRTEKQQEAARLTSENARLREQIDKLTKERAAGAVGAPPIAAVGIASPAEAGSAAARMLQMANETADKLVDEARVKADRLTQDSQTAAARIKTEADDYAKRTRSDADQHALQVTNQAKMTADDVTRRSTEEAQQRLDQASKSAQSITAEAKTRAERIDSEARVDAERLIQEAQQRASTIETEAQARRKELFSSIEAQRDDLLGKVDKLSAYEKSFRQTMTGYLQSQIERLETYQFRPDTTPELLQGNARSASDWAASDSSANNRGLEALLGA